MRKEKHKTKKCVDYYDQADILSEITDKSVEFSLEDRLRSDILLKRRRRKLQNITIKMDPLQVQAIRKLATSKSIPYQTLIRHWLSEEIKRELNLNK